jgi:hypothetical protein
MFKNSNKKKFCWILLSKAVKYLKGKGGEKEGKKGAKTLILLFLVLTGHREKSVRFIEKGLLLRHHTG